MAYSPHTWTRNETIASSLLNHMEQGIQSATETADKAEDAQELRAALDMMVSTIRAEIRALDARLTALENS